jgi:uncharacterized protein (DUF885 family)
MRKLFKWLFIILFVLVVLGGAFWVHFWYFKPATVNLFYARTFMKFAVDSPQMLSSMRILPSWADFYSDKLDDSSPAHEQKMADMLREDHDMLLRYDRPGLDRDGQLSYDVLEYFLRVQLDGEKYRDYDFPVNQMFGVQSTLPNFLAQQHPVKTASDANNYIARLDKFPVKFEQVIEGLRLRESKGVVPPQFAVEEVLKQMDGFTSKPAKENPLYVSFKEKLDKVPAESMDQATRTRLLGGVETSIQNSVYPAYKKLIDYFTALQPKAQGNFGAWHLPDGDAYYA